MISENHPNIQVQDHQRHCRQRLRNALLLTGVGLLLAMALFYFQARIITLGEFAFEYRQLVLGVMIPLYMLCTLEWLGYFKLKRALSGYGKILADLGHALDVDDLSLVQQTLSAAQGNARKNPLALAAIETHELALHNHLEKLTKADLYKKLQMELVAVELQCDEHLACLKSQVPLIKAEASIRYSLAFIQKRREEISRQWEAAYGQFSWWNKLKYAGTTPDFSEMDKVVRELKQIHAVLMDKYGADLHNLDAHFYGLKAKALARISASKSAAGQLIAEYGGQKAEIPDLLKKSIWFSALSLPNSMWADIDRAGNVYDALRQINGNFAGMSDAEIWWESLFMPAESLAGLAALTKGAYFEKLVAADTGGVLFEHFNHPDTDIIIDGIAYQLKATDSASYVNSVANGIPVIATSEVTLKTGAIDSGHSNEDLNQAVELALGGPVVDLGDSPVDVLLAGVGGLGLFATLEGIDHAVTRHKNGGDAVEAMFEGVGVAIEGTARAFVNTAEMSYKILASRPSRFVGRVLLKGLVKLDEKMMEK